MADDWASYFCNVNDKLASVFANVGLGSQAPIRSKPWLLWVWVYFRTPRPDGLSDGHEAPTLFQIEDALNLQLGKHCTAIPCGRITTDGRREFYFYGDNTEGFKAAVESAFFGFPAYKFDMGIKEDSSWEQYLNVLFPSPRDFERIKNQRLLDVLLERGDVLMAAREVQHWMYFPSEESRALFREEAARAGFKIGSESESTVQGDRPFGLTVFRTQSVEQRLIDATVIELLELAEKFGGEYDGWETPVITQ
jgi:uncharacterized protein (TIGR01619 family)